MNIRQFTGFNFAYGDYVLKHLGSWWEGRVVGFYSTVQTPIGYAIQLPTPKDNGPVQIYPEHALELVRSDRPILSHIEVKVKAYRMITKYASDEQKADPRYWTVSSTRPSTLYEKDFIIEELF